MPTAVDATPARLVHPSEAVVFGTFLLAALLLPTSTDVPIHDDGVYSWMAEQFRDGHFVVHPKSAAAAVFEAVWGGELLRAFGGGLGTLRWGSVILTLVGGVATALGAAALGVAGWRRALVAGSYLFNPIGFVLSYSFMTDAHAVALGAVAIACWLWAVRQPGLNLPLLGAGAVVAAIASMSRQPAVALALGMAVAIAVDRRMSRNRRVLTLAITIAPTVIATIAHQTWLSSQPSASQDDFAAALLDLGPFDLAVFVQQIVAVHVVYIVAMLLPLAGTVAVLAFRSWRDITRHRLLWLAAVGPVASAAVAALPGGDFPYVPSWFTFFGLGSWDLNGLPAALMSNGTEFAVTVVVCVTLALVGVVAFDRWPGFRRLGPGEVLCCCLLGTAILLAVPASSGFRAGVTLDRYLLPATVPAALLLGRALRGRRVRPFLPGALLVGFAAFSITGTYDELSFHRAIWTLDRVAAAAGASSTEIDAGPGLTTYRSYDMLDLDPAQPPVQMWWTIAIAPAVTGEWIISAAPRPGYEIVAVESYPTILQSRSSTLYLLRLE